MFAAREISGTTTITAIALILLFAIGLYIKRFSNKTRFPMPGNPTTRDRATPNPAARLSYHYDSEDDDDDKNYEFMVPTTKSWYLETSTSGSGHRTWTYTLNGQIAGSTGTQEQCNTRMEAKRVNLRN